MYQLFDLLSTDEFEALKADIGRRGVLVPVEYDERGVLLDGHHRVRACQELGIKDYPRVTRAGLTAEEKEEHVVTLNLRRRHLNTEQKRRWVQWFLERHPEWSDRRIAAEVGVSQPTVGTVRNKLINFISSPTHTVGADGKARPRTRGIVTHSQRQQQKAQELISTASEVGREDLLDKLSSGAIEMKRAERVIRDEVARAHVASTTHTPPAHCDLRLGDFREVLASLPDASVDIILTDPPYPGEYLPLWSDMAALAVRVLKPTGMLAAMSGQTYLPEVMQRLGEHLQYRWTMSYLMGGAANVVHARRVSTQWKPILVYGASDQRFHDVVRSDAGDKEHHHWGQSESGMAQLVRQLAQPGQLICDPFTGAGTTAVVALEYGCSFVGAEIDEQHYRTALARVSS